MNRWQGVRDVLRRLRRLPTDAELVRRATIDTWAKDMEDTAKRLAPKRTTFLANNIESRVNYGSGRAWVGVWNRKAMKYAYYVERGTSSMEAQPYLRPAAEIHRRTALRELRRQARRRFR